MSTAILLRILLSGWFLTIPGLLMAQGSIKPKSSGTSGRVLFETGFERFEGYDPTFDLVDSLGRGQNGWMAVGHGGNGVLTNRVDGFTGQYAYMGYQGPTNQSFSVNLFRPIQLVPDTNTLPVVVFQATFSIRDDSPSGAAADDFRWSVYTPNDQRLFTLDYHGPDQSINYALDDGKGFIGTGYQFEYDVVYQLEISMSFGRNRLSASLNGTPVVYELPLSTRIQRPSLGSVDVVWAANPKGTWNDNYMLFDDYRITAYPPNAVAPLMEMAGLDALGNAQLKVWGEPAVRYRIQSSNDLQTWIDRDIVVSTAPDGLATWTDTQPTVTRYYQAVALP
ncbi:MAG: hypothetical protein NT050_14460 [Verrucomicrobia bacterium]|nr:hypothetical protein [Verrucomicrobiota bacterium]